MSDDMYINALVDAVCKADETAVLALISLGGDATQVTEDDGESLLHWASTTFESSLLVPLLISKNCAINGKNKKGLTPLHYFVQRGYTFAVTCLLHNGADPTIMCDETKETAFDYAKKFNQVEIGEILESYMSLISIKE